MNRTHIILTPPFAFALAAVLAWFTGSPVEDSLTGGNTRVRSPRQRATAEATAARESAVLFQFERAFLLDPPPPVETHDAKGMDEALGPDDRNSGSGCCGTSALSYSIDWARESPEAMYDWLVRTGGTSFDRTLFPAYVLFSTWAEKDTSAALAAALAIPNRMLRRQALVSTLEILCKSDPARARELMLQNLSLFHAGGQSPIFNCNETGVVTCDMLLSLPLGEERTQLLATLLKDLARWSIGDEPAKALAVWKNAPESMRRDLVAAGFTNDGEKSASFEGLSDMMRERAETSGNPALAAEFIQSQGAEWARRDLAEALDWARAHLKGKSRVECSAGLFEQGARADFDRALDIWQNLPDDFLKVRAAGAIVRGAPAGRKAEADAMMRSLPEHDRLMAR